MTPGFEERAPRPRWAETGLIAGALMGVLEASERTWTLRPFLSGGLEPIGLWVSVVSFIALAGGVLGFAAGGVAGLLGYTSRAESPRLAAVLQVLAGGAIGAAGAAWCLLALTLTSRFDSLLDRGVLVIAAAGVIGAIATPLAVRWRGAVPRSMPGVAGTLLLLAVLPLYIVNVTFAPMSSIGVHVLLDTCMLAAALIGLQLVRTASWRLRLGLAWLGCLLMLGVAHFVMTTNPRIASLVKTRGSTSRRVVRGIAWLLDLDRDGFAPSWLTAGWDTDPFREGGARFTDPVEVAAQSPPAPAGHVGAGTGGGLRVQKILLVTIDALRADVSRGNRPTPLGAMRPETPVLDSLAAHAAAFRAAYTPSSGTGDTFASFYSDAELPGVLGVDPATGWLPEHLAAAGFRLTAVVDHGPFTRRAWGWPEIVHAEDSSRRAEDMALEALLAPGPAFVWIHCLPLHSELLSPFSLASYLPDLQRRRYAAGFPQVEEALDRLFSGLRAAGLAQHTLVVLSADHGEELGGHGHFNHNLSLYEPAVRVPLWISGPGVVPGDRSDVVAMRDVYPTLVEAAGLIPPATASVSLWPALRDTSVRVPERLVYLFLPQRGFSRKYAWIEPSRGQAALLDPVRQRKVILGIGRERFEAYDLARDPRERINLAGRGIPWVRHMRAALDSAIAVNSRPAGSPAR